MRRFLRRFLRWGRIRQLALSLASAVVAGAGLLCFYDIIVATFVLAVVICHEFGHFFAARRVGAALPLFIPLGLFVLGITVVRKPQRLPAYAAGPIAGLAAVLGGAAVGVVMGCGVLCEAAILLALVEIGGATLGADGTRIRAAIKKERPCSQSSAVPLASTC